MKSKKGLVPCLIAILGTSVLAQRVVPPPPKPADASPSLETTMKFIRDKLETDNHFHYQVLKTSPADGTTEYITFEYWLDDLVADAGACTVSGKYSPWSGSKPTTEFTVPMKSVQQLTVEPYEQYLTRVWTNGFAYNPPYPIASSSSPPITLLLLEYQGVFNGKPYPAAQQFEFHDASMADRVAKAITHAVELCGGGNKEPF